MNSSSKEQIEHERAVMAAHPGEPLVWRDGGFVLEKDLAASGNAPPAPAPAPLDTNWTPMPINDFYSGVVDGQNCGVVERLKNGRHEALAWAMDANGARLESPVYGLIPQADYKSVDPLDSQKPIRVYDMTQAASNERIAAATYARATMRENERSPQDMIGIASELAKEASSRQRDWQKAQEQAAEQAAQDAEDIALAARVRRGEQLLKAQEKK